MRIFGVSIWTIVIFAVAYWAGTKGLIGRGLAAVRGA